MRKSAFISHGNVLNAVLKYITEGKEKRQLFTKFKFYLAVLANAGEGRWVNLKSIQNYQQHIRLSCQAAGGEFNNTCNNFKFLEDGFMDLHSGYHLSTCGIIRVTLRSLEIAAFSHLSVTSFAALNKIHYKR